jgi:hypothetical protein
MAMSRRRNCGAGNDGLAMGPATAALASASGTVATAGRSDNGAIMKTEANATIAQERVLAVIKGLPDNLGKGRHY